MHKNVIWPTRVHTKMQIASIFSTTARQKNRILYLFLQIGQQKHVKKLKAAKNGFLPKTLDFKCKFHCSHTCSKRLIKMVIKGKNLKFSKFKLSMGGRFAQQLMVLFTSFVTIVAFKCLNYLWNIFSVSVTNFSILYREDFNIISVKDKRTIFSL